MGDSGSEISAVIIGTDVPVDNLVAAAKTGVKVGVMVGVVDGRWMIAATGVSPESDTWGSIEESKKMIPAAARIRRMSVRSGRVRCDGSWSMNVIYNVTQPCPS
jgi:hypothetical protein